jgi:diguanylate cyclase (GGDEF)-like protein
MVEALREDFQLAMVTLLGTCAVVAIAPFSVMRALAGEWLEASIDASIVVGMIAFMLFAWSSRRVQLVSVLSATFYTTACVLIINLRPESTVYWLFPVFMGNYFLLRLVRAAVINGLALLAILPATAALDTPLEASGAVVALLLVNALAGIFSWRTEDQHRQLHDLATRDALTHLGNRHRMQRAMAEAVAARNNRGASLSAILLDLDHFKSVNDRFGHDVGDALLVDAARMLTGRVRNGVDEVFRYGGEEFLLLLGDTQLREACVVAESLRRELQERLDPWGGPVTASFGCAELDSGESWENWISRADSALYAAKREGRNRVMYSSGGEDVARASPGVGAAFPQPLSEGQSVVGAIPDPDIS